MKKLAALLNLPAPLLWTIVGLVALIVVLSLVPGEAGDQARSMLAVLWGWATADE